MTGAIPRRTRIAVAALSMIALLACAAAWTFGPLAQAFDVDAATRYGAPLRAWPLAPLAVIGSFVLGGLVAAPGSLLIGATIVLFGPSAGSVYALLGMMASALVVYGIGRFTARDVVDAWLARRSGSKLDALNRLLARRGVVAVALMRLTPIPYSLQNVMAGAARIGVVDFVLGTALGLIPIFVVMTSLVAGVDLWRRVAADTVPTWPIGIATGIAVAVAVAVTVLAAVWLRERRRRRGAGER